MSQPRPELHQQNRRGTPLLSPSSSEVYSVSSLHSMYDDYHASSNADTTTGTGGESAPPRQQPQASQQRICRICLESDQDSSRSSCIEPRTLIAPCLCRGSAQWVHRGCLDAWRTQGSSVNATAFTHCCECGFEYSLRYVVESTESRDARSQRLADFRKKLVKRSCATFVGVQVLIVVCAVLTCILDEELFDKELRRALPRWIRYSPEEVLLSRKGVYYIYGAVEVTILCAFCWTIYSVYTLLLRLLLRQDQSETRGATSTIAAGNGPAGGRSEPPTTALLAARPLEEPRQGQQLQLRGPAQEVLMQQEGIRHFHAPPDADANPGGFIRPYEQNRDWLGGRAFVMRGQYHDFARRRRIFPSTSGRWRWRWFDRAPAPPWVFWITRGQPAAAPLVWTPPGYFRRRRGGMRIHCLLCNVCTLGGRLIYCFFATLGNSLALICKSCCCFCRNNCCIRGISSWRQVRFFDVDRRMILVLAVMITMLCSFVGLVSGLFCLISAVHGLYVEYTRLKQLQVLSHRYVVEDLSSTVRADEGRDGDGTGRDSPGNVGGKGTTLNEQRVESPTSSSATAAAASTSPSTSSPQAQSSPIITQPLLPPGFVHSPGANMGRGSVTHLIQYHGMFLPVSASDYQQNAVVWPTLPEVESLEESDRPSAPPSNIEEVEVERAMQPQPASTEEAHDDDVSSQPSAPPADDVHLTFIDAPIPTQVLQARLRHDLRDFANVSM
ncbi:unnamed protein product [Amoebophrya sp. A25]|nr:unnamed protein product [Amoebophrya sp. A25]|eukprot:GSA25T00004047001.1